MISSHPADLPFPKKAAASHATDFEPPIYNVWKQQEKTAGGKHFGNSEIRWVDNLLYLYTKPFDIVVAKDGKKYCKRHGDRLPRYLRRSRQRSRKSSER